MEDLTGVSAHTVIGKNSREIFPKMYEQGIVSMLERALSGEAVHSLGTTSKVFDTQKEGWILGSYSPHVSPEGKIIGVVAIISDITERKKAEDALHDSEERLSNFMESATDNFILLDSEMKVTEINKSALNLIKMKKPKALNKNYLDIFPNIKDLEKYKKFRKIHETGKPLFIEDFIPPGKFGKLHLSLKAFKVGEGLGIITTDMTERILAEEALQESEQFNKTIVTSVGEGIIVYDQDLRYMAWNSFMEELTGLPPEVVLKKHASEILPDLFYKDIVKLLKRALSGELVHSEDTAYYIPELDKEGWISISYSPHISVSGKTIGVVAIIRDITIRKKADDELKASREQLRNLATHLETAREEERKQIAYEIHDDLGQSLTALKIDLSWITKRMDLKQTVLIERSESMSALIDATINKVRTLSSQLRPSILDHFGLVAAIEWQAEEFEKRTSIPCNIVAEPKDFVLDDYISTGIFRIFQETITNVTRHAHATKVDVSLKLKNGGLELIVSDNGVGITQEQINDHSAFGLMGIRERANFAGGEAEIIGSENNGTTITVTVPLSNKEDTG